MSSLAATQADGYYIPPSYLDSGAYKKKSLSQFNNSKGHNQFLTHSVARFELPFDGFCTDCGEIVGKGTRFNAHKAHVDDYFTTKIFEFTTTCRACGKCEFKIRTNPKERTFDYIVGLRKKVEEFDSAEAGTIGVIDTEFGNGILQYKNGKLEGEEATTTPSNSLQLLEKNVVGYRRVQTEYEHMTSLLKLNSKMGDDADANASLRSGFRKDRKAKKRRFEEAVGLGLGRGIELKAGNDEDASLAKRTMDMHRREENSCRAHQIENNKFREARRGSIFQSKQKSKQNNGRIKNKSGQIAATKSCAKHRKMFTPNQQLPIGQQKPTSPSVKPAKGKASTVVSESSLAALSSCYASDND